MRFLVGIFLLISIQVYSQDLYNQAAQLITEGKYKQALPLLEELMVEEPQNPIYLHNRAIAYLNLKQYPKAIKDLNKLSKDNPYNYEYPYLIGDVYERKDSFKLAVKYYSTAIEISKDEDFSPYFKRGTCYLNLKDYKHAVEDFTESIKINDEHDNSYHNRGIAYYKLGLKEKACMDWCQALLKGNPYSASHLDKNCERYPQPCLLKK
jgi:tetratricopeptide (TPR) repeat protein